MAEHEFPKQSPAAAYTKKIRVKKPSIRPEQRVSLMGVATFSCQSRNFSSLGFQLEFDHYDDDGCRKKQTEHFCLLVCLTIGLIARQIETQQACF